MDLGTAFLAIWPPDGVRIEWGCDGYQLKKAFYILKQAPRAAWYIRTLIRSWNRWASSPW